MGGWPSFNARTIKYDPLFESAASAIQPDAKRLDAQLRGAEWAIATKPEAFDLVPGTILRILKTDPWPDAPPLRIYFSIDDDTTCTLRWIEIVEGPAEGEDFSG
jgi:hypothetical protein